MTSTDPDRNDAVASTYRRIAPLYDLVDLPFEWLRYRPLRRTLAGGATGRVLEAGVGTGRNLAWYAAAASVTGVELSPAMLERARPRARAAPCPVHLQQGDITALPFEDGAFDTVVSSFVLCVLPESLRDAALAEMARVCAPDGRIRLLEYQRSRRPVRAAVMRLWEPWARWAFGAAFDLDLDAMITRAGLTTETSRFLVSDIVRLLVLRR